MTALFTAIAEQYWLAATLVALLSLCVGSFLNVVIYRLPMIMQQHWHCECEQLLHPEQPATPPTMTLSTPASSCPACGHQIRWYENIPVISWLVLRGKCSNCGTPISWRYPLVELGTMLASLVVFFTFGPTLQMLAGLVFTWALVALTGIDFDTMLLPDRITLPLVGAGLLANSFGLFTTPVDSMLGCVIGGICLWLIVYPYELWTKQEGMGTGDYKLLAALGAWAGAHQLLLIALLASCVGAVVGLYLKRFHGGSSKIPFGPYLAIAGWIALMFGNSIIDSYMRYAFPNAV